MARTSGAVPGGGLPSAGKSHGGHGRDQSVGAGGDGGAWGKVFREREKGGAGVGGKRKHEDVGQKSPLDGNGGDAGEREQAEKRGKAGAKRKSPQQMQDVKRPTPPLPRSCYPRDARPPSTEAASTACTLTPSPLSRQTLTHKPSCFAMNEPLTHQPLTDTD